jgi:hypothetical protein
VSAARLNRSERENGVTHDERMPEIQGRVVQLENGAKVWGGLHGNSVVWRFTSKDGATTDLSLSREAMAAVIHIFQGLIGCDRDFAAVSFMPPESAVSES